MAQNHDHFNAKVDALFQKFDNLTVSVVTPTPVLLPFEVYGIFGHIWSYCFNPQNLFGQQTAPPNFANNQRGPQKFNLELLLENFVLV